VVPRDLSRPLSIIFFVWENKMIKNVNELKKYITQFDLKVPEINRKYKHSIRVMKISKKLAKKNHLSKEEIYLASMIGLLHDYGRFEQWHKYKTFRDLESIDHGDLGVELLFNDNHIKKFNVIEKDYDEIYDAIKYHNKLDYENNLSVHNKLHCKIIRDADKIDIFYQLAYGIIYVLEDNENVSNKIDKNFYQKTKLNRKDLENESDNVLLTLAMLYDLNYIESLEYINNKKYLWKWFNKINDKSKFYKYFEYMDKYINERIEENVR